MERARAVQMSLLLRRWAALLEICSSKRKLSKTAGVLSWPEFKAWPFGPNRERTKLEPWKPDKNNLPLIKMLGSNMQICAILGKLLNLLKRDGKTPRQLGNITMRKTRPWRHVSMSVITRISYLGRVFFVGQK
ncbi:hypothetical protein BC940DRAFT_291022 [Gongronella butleri]|nr:hypothetical protein BC940DRAFT_291022 [Gongronella butleri]